MRWPVPVLVMMWMARSAAADPTAAADASKEAERLATAGDFTGAVAKFREANRLDPRAEFVCDIGIAYRKANELSKAQRFLADCLLRATTFDPKFVGQIRSALAEVEDTLRAGAFTPVEITAVPPGASYVLDGDAVDDALVGSRIVWLPFGAHEVVADADGFVARHVAIDAKTTDRQVVRIILDRIPVTASPSPVPVPPPPPPVPAPRRVAPSRTHAIIAFATSGAFAVAGIGLYVHARSVNDSAGSTTIDMAEYQRRLSSAANYEHASWVFGGAAAVAAGLGTYLWLRTRTLVEITAGSHGATLAVTRAW